MRSREERSVQPAMELYRERLALTTGSSSIPDTIRSSYRPREQCRHVLRAVADGTDETATICKSVIRLPGSVGRRRPGRYELIVLRVATAKPLVLRHAAMSSNGSGATTKIGSLSTGLPDRGTHWWAQGASALPALPLA